MRCELARGLVAQIPAPVRCDVTELVVVSLPDPPEFLVIEAWHEGRGVTRSERR